MSQAIRRRSSGGSGIRRRLLPALIVLLAAGCARATQKREEGAAEGPVMDVPARIEVENLNRLDIVIYQIADGRTLRLGRARAFETSTFDLRVARVTMTDVRFIAEPTGARSGFTQRHTSDRVSVRGGDLVVWRLESGLERSIIEVRAGVGLEAE